MSIWSTKHRRLGDVAILFFTARILLISCNVVRCGVKIIFDWLLTHNGKQEEKYLIFFIILYLIVETLYTDTKKKKKLQSTENNTL